MKKQNILISAVAVMALLMMTLTGCGSSGSGTAGSANDAKDAGSSDKVYEVGILQQLEHPALDQATEGFKEALTDKLGEDGVTFDVQNAQGETANCSTIASGFVTSKVDLIMANATNALQAASQATADIPIVGTSVTDYATALNIKDWTGATGNNVTGTSDLAPLSEQAKMIQELCPDAKTIGLLYCSAEANSKYQVEEIEKELDGLGIAYKEYTCADSNEVQAMVTRACGECEALYIPTDNTLASSTETIKNVIMNSKTPVIAGEQGICEGCGVATLSISYHDIGYAAGEMAYEILVNGEDPGSMDIETAENVTKLYNPEICEALGITVPSDYKAIESDEE